MVNSDDWDRAWKERDLRRTGLMAGVYDAGNDAVQTCSSNHEMTRVDSITYDSPGTFSAENRVPPVRSTISSDIPGEDGIREYSRETLTWHCPDLSQVNLQRTEISLQEALQSDNAQREPSLPADIQGSHVELQLVQNWTPIRSQSIIRSERMVSNCCAEVYLEI